VEILVVLAIIAVVSSIMVLGLGGGGSEPGPRAEARRLAQSLQLAAEEELVTDHVIALDWDSEGYSFVAPEGDGWKALNASALGERHKLPADINLTINGEQLPVPIDENRPLYLRLGSGSEAWGVQFDGLNATVVPDR
jgi:type II secretion system protein H